MTARDTTPSAAKRAEKMIRHFEMEGRQVKGVTIKGHAISVIFADDVKPEPVEAVDLVNMSE